MVSPTMPLPPRSEAEEIIRLKKQLEWANLKIVALQEQLRLERIRKYGAKSEKLSDAQLELLEAEPGVSATEVEAETTREPLPPSVPRATADGSKRRHPGRQTLPVGLPRVEASSPARRNNAPAPVAAGKHGSSVTRKASSSMSSRPATSFPSSGAKSGPAASARRVSVPRRFRRASLKRGLSATRS